MINLVEVKHAEIPEKGWMHDTAMRILLPKDIAESFTINPIEDDTRGMDRKTSGEKGTGNVAR